MVHFIYYQGNSNENNNVIPPIRMAKLWYSDNMKSWHSRQWEYKMVQLLRKTV